MRNSNRSSMINDVQGCFGNRGIVVDYRGTKQALARFLEVVRLRVAMAAIVLRSMLLHERNLVVAGFASTVGPKRPTALRQSRTWHGLHLAPAVVPVR